MFKHKIMAVSALVLALFVGHSCDDTDVYTFPEPGNEELSTLDVMRKDPDFANFLDVVDRCGEGCLDSLLNQSRVYTFWVPVNESINRDSLVQCIEDGNRESVFQEFVKFHIANYLHPANGVLADDNNILMLNDKYVTFSGDSQNGYIFGGKALVETNIRTKNGLIHKISSSVDYRPSIWEALKSINSIESFWDFCYSFTEKEIDHANSVPGPIVNQQQTYLDTLYVESNEMTNMSNLGPIDDEDSTYIMYVPTSEVWDRVVSEAPNYFKFNTEGYTDVQKREADSISQVRGAKAYLRYLVYNMADQKFAGDVVDFDNLPDSLVSRYRENPRKKVPVADLTPIEVYDMSNGQLRILDHMPFTPMDLWHDTIVVQAENTGNIRKDENDRNVTTATLQSLYVTKDDVNETYKDLWFGKNKQPYGTNAALGYMSFLKLGSDHASAKYFVRNILSAKYKIALITIPADVRDEEDAAQYASSLHVDVSHNGKKIAGFPTDKTVSFGTKKWYEATYRPEIAAMDTIFLTDDESGEPYIFEFESCEEYSGISLKSYTDDDYTLEITVSTAPLAKKIGIMYMDDNTYEANFRLDAILILPVEDEDSAE